MAMAADVSMSFPPPHHLDSLTPTGYVSAKEIGVLIENVEKLLEENEVMEKKIKSLSKKRGENSKKIGELVKRV